MEWLWSPWRYSYVARGSTQGCIFCEKSREDRDRENLILYRGALNFVILNAFPYTSGHLMIAPYEHVGWVTDARTETLEEMIRLARTAERALREVYQAPGLNIGMNLGACAGAGVADHIHLHVLPRWPGDTNFMTTIGETRVLPEDLTTTWEKLRPRFQPETSSR
jgi:ATP adenylyltransferase